MHLCKLPWGAQGGKEVVLEVVKRSCYAIASVLGEAQGAKEVVLDAVEQNCYALECLWRDTG